ncbi:hypothetical protein D3C77_713990 [compost metagenome]
MAAVLGIGDGRFDRIFQADDDFFLGVIGFHVLEPSCCHLLALDEGPQPLAGYIGRHTPANVAQ